MVASKLAFTSVVLLVNTSTYDPAASLAGSVPVTEVAV